MIKKEINFPKSAYYNKVLAKDRFYTSTNIKSKNVSQTKDLLTQKVKQIRWLYTLAPRTINLNSSENVKEIQVIRVSLPALEIDKEVLSIIDKSIPSPIIFELEFEDKICYATCLKSYSDKIKLLSDYFISDWIEKDDFDSKEGSDKQNFPVVLDLESLYHWFIKELSPIGVRKLENVEDLCERIDRIKELEKKIKVLESRRDREKQYKIKVELNKELGEMRVELEKKNDG